jgi:putative acetyltransferase
LAATPAGPPGIAIRRERPADGPEIRSLVDAAFAPSTLEGRIVDALRAGDRWLPDLALVAVGASGSIVGHVVTSLGDLTSPNGAVGPILALGPLAVAPDAQGRGIGGALMRATIAIAIRQGWPVIVLLGHDTYYPTFGFESARALGIEPPEPWDDKHWMALRLPAWSPEVRGAMRYPSAFDID